MTDTTQPRPKRVPAGAAVKQPHVTAAITAAAFAELAEVGYGRLSMEAVARRAGVSKPTLYRRWSSKEQLAIELTAQAATATDAPDTGTLRGDVHAFVTAIAENLSHPLVARIVPDLLAEGLRTPALATQLRTTIGGPRRAKAGEMLRRAVERGELPADLDLGLALDLLAGPLFWRLIMGDELTEPAYLDRLTDMIIAALRG